MATTAAAAVAAAAEFLHSDFSRSRNKPFESGTAPNSVAIRPSFNVKAFLLRV